MTPASARVLILRGATVLCVVLATSGLTLRSGETTALPIAIFDVSASLGSAVPELPEGYQVSPRWIVVAAGAHEILAGGTQPALLGRGETRLGEGLRKAAGLHPGRDVVLFTDGGATHGDAVAGARAVRSAGGRVFVRGPVSAVADIGFREARIRRTGKEIVVVATVEASTAGRVTVILTRDGQRIDTREAAVLPGVQRRLTMRDPSPPSTGAGYRLRLAAVAGTPNDIPGNDELALGWRSERRSLLVVGIDDAGPLQVSERTQVVTAARLKPEMLAAADAVVLAGVPWARIAEGMEGLGRFVRGGGQLLLLGGPHAYRPGGWAGKPIETDLSALQTEQPDGRGLALLLLIDRSGSTAKGALAHLRAAGRSAALRLAPGESLGVLPFAAGALSMLPPGFIRGGDDEAQAALLRSLSDLAAHGKTDVPAAIEAGIAQLTSADADQRWLVLLTDGDPDHSLGAAELVPLRARLDAAGVEIAALVVGDATAAAAIRQSLARRPQDVMLLANPESFGSALDELVRGRRLREDELPAPDVIEHGSPAPLGIDWAGVKPHRMHALEAARGATVLARATWGSEDRPAMPFLARRQVGAGVVWSVAGGPAFETSLASRRTWLRVVGQAGERLAAQSDRGITAERLAGDVVVRLSAALSAGASGALRVRGRRLDGTAFERLLVETRPGFFRGPVPPVMAGSLMAVLADTQVRPLRLPVRPGPEFRGTGINEGRLRAIAAAGGGWRLIGDERPPKRPRAPRVRLGPWLLLLAGILLGVERGLSRRLSRADSGHAGTP